MVDVCDKNRVDEAGKCLECRVLPEGEGTCVCLKENGKCHAGNGSGKCEGRGNPKAGPKRISGKVAGITFTAEVVEDEDDDFDEEFDDEFELGISGAGAGCIGGDGGRHRRRTPARPIPDPEENWDGFYAEFLKFSQDRPVGRHTLDDDDAA